jgi:glycosyltransferase involved in cell wall biosynthesis
VAAYRLEQAHAGLNLLYIHERYGALAGAEANVFITATELSARGHKVGILHGPSTGKNEAGWNKVFEFREPLDARSVTKHVGAFQPDAFFIHKSSELPVLEAVAKSGVPVARMVHDHDIYCMRSYKYGVFSRKICTRAASAFCVFGCGAFVARNHGGALPVKFVSYSDKLREIEINRGFDRMCVVTTFMRDELLKNGFSGDRIEIHPPVPRPGDATIRSSFSDRNLIIYAGQIIRGKGVDVLIESLARVKEPFECIILGDGSHKPFCEKLTRKLGLQDRIKFLGFVPQDELKRYYRECSVVAISSVWPEPIATIGLEVMRYALPVVAFDAGGIKDWLKNGHNGYLVPWMDRNAFAAAIDDLLRDKQKARRMGENGLALVSEQYDFDRYVAGLEAMFQQLSQKRVRKLRAPRPSEAVPTPVKMAGGLERACLF